MDNIIYSTQPDINKIPGGWFKNFSPELKKLNPLECNVNTIYGRAHVFEQMFTETECDQLIEMFMQSPNFEGVSIQGRKDVPDDRIGSIRTTVWNPELAQKMWEKKFAQKIFNRTVMSPSTPTDWWQGNDKRRIWYTYGISPMMRFMKYEKTGQHYAHYDAGYIYKNDNYRTLYSFVLYLTTNIEGGSTRFIKDGQDNINAWDRNHDDWIREANPEEILAVSKPIKGNVLIFPHRYCHDVEQYLGDTPRIIIRGDIIFKHLKHEENYYCSSS